MRADVRCIGDFKFPLLDLVCSCLSLSLGRLSVVCIDSASQPAWYSFGLCPQGFLLRMWSVSFGQLSSGQHFDGHRNGKVIGHSTAWDGLRQMPAGVRE